jgi:hypothetical protein
MNNLHEWVTDAAQRPTRRGEYMEQTDAERAYMREYVRDYAVTPLPNVDGKLRLATLLTCMNDMERALEQGRTREQWEAECDECHGIDEHDARCSVAEADRDAGVTR